MTQEKTVVEKEEDMVKMPNIIGKKQEEAIKMLNAEGLGYQTPVRQKSQKNMKKAMSLRQM